MSCAAIAISVCLLSQARDTPNRYEPRFEPRASPAAPIDDDPPARSSRSVPADDALGAPEGEPEPPSRPASRYDEPSRASVRDEPDNDTPGGSRQKVRPPEILAEALAKPQEAALTGKPVSLLTALSRTTDRQQQLRIARAYWRLATAQADYHWALDQREKLKHYTESHTNEPETLSARASARADVRDAELAATQAQQELADLLGGTNDSPPLAIDRPHVGGYNTYYEEIFANRAPPARIRLIHRMLPIRRKAIDAHGEAILAAIDALEATGEEFKRSGQGLTTTLTALDQLKHERKLFVAAVRDYNLEIAEYLFAVIPPGTSDKTLVSKLILTTERGQSPATKPQEDRTFAPSESEAGGDTPARGAQRTTPRNSRVSKFQQADTAADAALYAGLAELTDDARIEKLSGLLHWERARPADAGRPAPLAECLRNVAPAARQSLLTAYWSARECAARYQTFSEQVDQLSALASAVTGAHQTEGMAEAGVRLQAVRRAAAAAVVDAEAELIDAEFVLTQAAGQPLDAAWLLPESLPQTHAARAAEDANPGVQHRAEIIDVQHARLEDLADAVIQADAGRAAAAAGSHLPQAADAPAAVDYGVWTIVTQTNDTLSFLSGLTEYNLSVGEQALATLPANVSAEELAAKLAGAGSGKNEL